MSHRRIMAVSLGASYLPQLVRIGPQPIRQARQRIVPGGFVVLRLHPRRFGARIDARW